MIIRIVKNTMPRYNAIFGGKSISEVDKFLEKPKKIDMYLTEMPESEIPNAPVKIQQFLIKELGLYSNTSASDIKIVSWQTTTSNRGKCSVMLSKNAWREAFGEAARLAWHKISDKVALEKKRRVLKKKKLRAKLKASSLPAKRNKLRDVLVRCVSINGSIRVRAAGVNHPDWNVSFPKSLRAIGAQYVVEQLKVADGFYKAVGKITRVL